MHIGIRQDADQVSFIFFPESDDRRRRGKVRLVRTVASFSMPSDFDVRDAHPDLLGLAGLLCIYPFTHRFIDNAVPVSAEFAQCVSENLGKEFRNVDRTLKPRSELVTGGGRPGLAYSGGADCTAAAHIMPEDTALFYLKRTTPNEIVGWRGYCSRDAVFDDSTATGIVNNTRSLGREIYTVGTDLEYLRHPVGFPTDLASAIPGILMADYSTLDSIGWGTIMEAAYGIGRGGFIDFGLNYQNRRAVFSAVGLPFFNAVAGVSEVGTMRIASSAHQERGLTFQSCSRNIKGEPCLSCAKCFRKAILGARISQTWPPQETLDSLFSSQAVRSSVTATPMRLASTIAFALSEYEGQDHRLRLIRDRMMGGDARWGWVGKHYLPALDLIPKRYALQTRRNLERHVRVMQERDVASLRSFDIGSPQWNQGQALDQLRNLLP